MQLIGNSGPFFEKLFPWPPTKLHGKTLKPVEEVIWKDRTQGQFLTLNPSQIRAQIPSGNNTVSFIFLTQAWERSYLFIRHLAFMFPIRRIVLDHYRMNPSGCLKNNSKCNHKKCLTHTKLKNYTLSWRTLPHPIYEVEDTMDLIKASSHHQLTEDEYGRIYHHLIREGTFFATYENPVIINARTIFEEQLDNLNNLYLSSTALFNHYNQSPFSTVSESLGHAFYIARLYSQPKNNGQDMGLKKIRP